MISTKLIKPSKKAKDSYKHIINNVTTITLLEGAVRSSKSFTIDQAVIKLLKGLPPCDVLISGKSSGSVARNVISQWKKKLGSWRFKNVKDGKDEYMTINYLGLSNKKFYVRGGGKKGDEEQIQGATFGVWLGDEITNQTKDFVEMALSRLSLEYSQAVWSANPDFPDHYIKTDYIDRYVEENNFFKVIKFTLNDNSSLSEKVKKRLRDSFFGVFYLRKILGQWVRAEGLVYPMFNPKEHVLDVINMPKRYQELRVGIDYGTQNPMTYNYWGRVGKVWYKIAEYWHSGRHEAKQGRNGQKTNSQYKDDMINFFKENNIPKNTFVIADPSASSFKLELFRAGFKVGNGNNSVLKGIEFLSNLLGKNRIRYSKECKETIKELMSYSWDEKKGDRGQDVPLKDNDHCLDGDRYALYTQIGGMK